MSAAGLSPEQIADAAQAFAAQRLGPRSQTVLGDPARLALAVARVTRRGQAPEDAVLAELHGQLEADPTLVDEFLAYFLSDLDRLGHGRLAPGLRRFVDTGDLVQSVLGDLWPELSGIRFESRDSFLALLAARLRWKASDSARAAKAGKRREDLRSELPAQDFASAETPGPATELVRAEEWQQVALSLARLPERDRDLVRGHLRGESWQELAAAYGLQPESARKAVQRALERLRGGGADDGGRS